MAKQTAIAAVSQTLLGIIEDAIPSADFPQANFDVLKISDFQQSQPLTEGVSLYLYRVNLSDVQRNLRSARQPNRQPPLPIDLHYMLTAWGQTSATQQRLLGIAMRTLADYPSLSAGVLNHYGRPEQNFDEHETVELMYEPMTFQDMTSLWDLLKPNAEVSVTYVVRMLYLESNITDETYADVQGRVFEYGREADE